MREASRSQGDATRIPSIPGQETFKTWNPAGRELPIRPLYQPGAGKHPHSAGIVAEYNRVIEVRQSVLRRVGGEFALLPPRHPAVFRAHPQIAVAVFVKRDETIAV